MLEVDAARAEALVLLVEGLLLELAGREGRATEEDRVGALALGAEHDVGQGGAGVRVARLTVDDGGQAAARARRVGHEALMAGVFAAFSCWTALEKMLSGNPVPTTPLGLFCTARFHTLRIVSGCSPPGMATTFHPRNAAACDSGLVSTEHWGTPQTTQSMVLPFGMVP